MGIKDLIITPFFLFLFLGGSLFFKYKVNDPFERSFFTPALLARFVGAISIGLLYQFYYGGGDTFNYFYHSELIWSATLENPLNFFRFFFSGGEFIPEVRYYISRMYWFYDSSSFFVAKVSSLFGLFSFNTYSVVALCFSIWAFSGSWALFSVFSHRYPQFKVYAAISAFFIPSCVIWGSGLFKDTLTFGAIGWLLYGFYHWVIIKKYSASSLIMALLGFYILYSVKVYILLSLVPCLIGWWVLENLKSVKSPVSRAIISPFFFIIAVVLGGLSLDQIAEENAKFDLDNIALTAQTTAYDIAYWTGKGAGSTYTLGELDGTLTGMLQLAPQGIIVTLFRPWIWEVSNVLMLISGLESLGFLIITILVFRKVGFKGLSVIWKDPFILFALVFALTFAAGLGVSTFNFGSLSRYKIPLLPFYLFAILLIYGKSHEAKMLDKE